MPDLTVHLRIDAADLDDLLSALRRRDRADADRLLDRWATSETHLAHDLSAWVHREASQHVAGGRFEHALCLVETYRRPVTAADMKARITPSPRALL